MKQNALAAAALVASGLAAAATAPSATTGHGKAQATRSEPSRPLVVVYTQEGTDAGISTVSQNFESAFDIYDSRAADDFTVTKAKIFEVDVTGTYFVGTGPARSVNVTFYRNRKHLPGAVIADYPDVPMSDNGTGSFVIPIPRTVIKGTAWVSVQANMDLEGGGEWGWENQTTFVGRPAEWENPGDGFATGCTTYAVESVCLADGQGDHLFTLRGNGG